MGDQTVTGRAFYARGGSRGADFATLLHPPYTLWHLSYVAIGAALAPDLDPVVLAGTLAAFLLGLGVGAHALDEVHGRPLRTGFGDGALWAMGIGGIAGGFALGVVGVFWISPLVLAWAGLGVALAAGYALEWPSWLHSDWGFAVAWGAFPVLVGFWAQTEAIAVAAVIGAAATTVISRAQRALSTPARRLRRGGVELEPDQIELLETWERPLRLLSLTMPLLALALLATHL